jgi:predicted nucleic-acid-binding protein
MLAVDTNIIIRYVVEDDPRQAKQARTLIDGQHVFIPTSVILETEWVLRSMYAFDRAAIAETIRTLAGQPTVTLEHPVAVHTALHWADQGVEFADALHLAASQHCEAFASFDRELGKTAKRAGAIEVRAP